jgi:homoserine O-succinyltransferase/O-acetyltransferase
LNEARMALMESFQVRAVQERRESLISEFPMASLQDGLENTWRRPANKIYGNWVEYLKDRKAERRTLSSKARRSRGDVWRVGNTRSAAGGSAG